jgi:hypothetical protein
MAKRRLTELAEEYGITFEKAKDIAFKNFDEEMISGTGKNTWIDEKGQAILDDLVPIDIIYRGRVLKLAPNQRFVIAYVKELTAKIPVRVPLKYRNNLVNKVIHIQADNTSNTPKYHWIPTKIRQ